MEKLNSTPRFARRRIQKPNGWTVLLDQSQPTGGLRIAKRYDQQFLFGYRFDETLIQHSRTSYTPIHPFESNDWTGISKKQKYHSQGTCECSNWDGCYSFEQLFKQLNRLWWMQYKIWYSVYDTILDLLPALDFRCAILYRRYTLKIDVVFMLSW